MAQPTTPDAPTPTLGDGAPQLRCPEHPRRRTRPCSSAPCSRSSGSSSARTGWSSGCSSRCWPAGTACSRACPAWPRPSRWRPWPRWSAAASPGSSSPRTWCPADIMGTRIYRQSSENFDVELGPVFVNFLLADEINRAPAKVQSALLEVMAEQQVSIGGQTYEVPHAVPGHGHPEPDRAGGRLPAAGGAARPVPDEDRRRLPDRRRGARDRLPDGRTRARADAGARPRAS